MRDLRKSGPEAPQRIAVCGAGISGLSAAWLLSKRHQVTLYETEARLGGHTIYLPVRPSASDSFTAWDHWVADRVADSQTHV